MLTAGVDLSAEPKGTALAVVEWLPGSAILRELRLGVSDEPVLEIASRVDKLGIDCALGWPEDFIAFLNAQSDLSTPHYFDGGMDWRRQLSYRETDRHARELTGRWPLSVSTDRLGLTAMRAAGLLSKLAQSGVAIDRTGAGLIAEVYPGATLRLWGFDAQGYRTSADSRAELLANLKQSAPWFDPGDFDEHMVNSCDAFDAVVASLATRAVATGSYHQPSQEQSARAAVEGWICLPTTNLNSLVA